jgi:hypothetical protein
LIPVIACIVLMTTLFYPLLILRLDIDGHVHLPCATLPLDYPRATFSHFRVSASYCNSDFSARIPPFSAWPPHMILTCFIRVDDLPLSLAYSYVVLCTLLSLEHGLHTPLDLTLSLFPRSLPIMIVPLNFRHSRPSFVLGPITLSMNYPHPIFLSAFLPYVSIFIHYFSHRNTHGPSHNHSPSPSPL